MKPCLSVVAILICASVSHAQTFSFQPKSYPPDVLIGFRQDGNPNEIVMNAGPISQFTKATPGSKFKVTAVVASELSKVYGTNLDQLGFAVFSAVRQTGTTAPAYPTMWASKERTDRETPADPWFRQSKTSLAITGAKIETLGANTVSWSLPITVGPDNNTTLTVMPSGLNLSYSTTLGSGNFGLTFQGDVQTYLPTGFGSGSASVRADFFQLDVGSGPGTWIGTFDFTGNNELWFTAAGGSIPNAPAPTIQSFARNGSRNSITFTTIAGGYTYTLLQSPVSGIGAPIAQWTTVPGASIVGTGNPATLNDISDSDSKFYRVQVNP